MKIILSLLLIMISFVTIAKEIKLSDSGISFIAPDEFEPLSQDIIEIKWPKRGAPKWAIGNESASTSIAYDLKPHDISAAPLPKLMKTFKAIFERVIPGIDWKKSEIIELSGKSWLYLEMTSTAVDADIYNIMLLTSYGKKMLIFNFNSTKRDFPKYEAALRKSWQTIILP